MARKAQLPQFVVITPQLDENRATKKALCIGSSRFRANAVNQETSDHIGDYTLFEVGLNGGCSTTIALKCMDGKYNCPCAVLTERLLASMEPEYVFLLGSGCGNPSKDDVFQVVLGQAVLHLGRGRKKGQTTCPRPDVAKVGNIMKNKITAFRMDIADRQSQWNRECRRLLREIHNEEGELPAALSEKRSFQLRSGTIASDDLVLSWDTIKSARAWWGRSCDEARAYDMESSGFSYVCDDRRVNWAVFRGISDRGLTTECKNHFSAAAVAAICLRRFIEFLTLALVPPGTIPAGYDYQRLFNLLQEEERRNSLTPDSFVAKGRFIREVLQSDADDVLALAQAIAEGAIEEYQAVEDEDGGRTTTAIRLDRESARSYLETR